VLVSCGSIAAGRFRRYVHSRRRLQRLVLADAVVE
jgi:hypothetical protein